MMNVDITRIITRKQTLETKKDKECYVILKNGSGRFDYLDYEHEYYEMKFRVIRFKISEDAYECIITNLGRDEFSPDELKGLYQMRWNEETSFQELKYKVGLINSHSKKRKYLKQEIYARFILFNLSNMVIQRIDIRNEIDIDNLIARIKKFWPQ